MSSVLPSGDLRGLRVLLVEDSYLVASSLSRMIRDMGCEVIGPVATVEEALPLVSDGACDVGILDVNLGPGEPSGVDVHGWLRSHGFAGDVVFLTGHARTHPLVAAAVATPGTRVFAKPIDESELARLVQ